MVIPVVEISFDKVVGHLFSDSMSLVIHEVAPWLGILEIAVPDSFKDLFSVVSLHQTGDCESGSKLKTAFYVSSLKNWKQSS